MKLAKGGETSIVYGLPSKFRDPSTCLIIAHGDGGPMHTPFIRYFHTELAKQGFLTVTLNFPDIEERRRVSDRRQHLEARSRKGVEQANNRIHKPHRMPLRGKRIG